MQKVVFIAPTFDNRGPRTIRIENFIRQLPMIDPIVLKYEKSFMGLWNGKSDYKRNNRFSFIHLVFRFFAIYKIGHKISKKVSKIGALALSNFLIKWDLRSRKAELNNEDVVFVVVVSPFTNYLLVPWLKMVFSKALIVIDVGDPLYLNSARDNNDEYSKEVEQSAVSEADTILVTNQATKKFFVDTYRVAQDRITVVPQGVDLELISFTKPARSESIPHTLAYAGRFYKGLRWPVALFEAMAMQNKYTLHLYGSSWGKAETNVIEHPKMPQKQLFSELHSNEILVFIDNDKGIQTSGKIYELLTFGKPLLFIKGSERSEAEALAENHPHVIFTENVASSILKALKKHELSGLSMVSEQLVEYSWKARAVIYKKALEI